MTPVHSSASNTTFQPNLSASLPSPQPESTVLAYPKKPVKPAAVAAMAALYY